MSSVAAVVIRRYKSTAEAMARTNRALKPTARITSTIVKPARWRRGTPRRRISRRRPSRRRAWSADWKVDWFTAQVSLAGLRLLLSDSRLQGLLLGGLNGATHEGLLVANETRHRERGVDRLLRLTAMHGDLDLVDSGVRARRHVDVVRPVFQPRLVEGRLATRAAGQCAADDFRHFRLTQ